uniref:PKD_channel domain-containing protein n=1 Tax=Haemonchus placei TaxID=6290 RepID=A0A0N4X615_HAEPC
LNNIIIALLSFLFTISISAYIADTDIVYYYQFETSGSLEYLIDVAEEYDEEGTIFAIFGPVNRVFLLLYDIAPFIALVNGLVELVDSVKEANWTWLFSPTPDHPSYDRIHELDSYEKDFPTQETPMLEQKSSEGMVAAKTTPSTGTLSNESAEPMLRKSKLPTRRIKQSAEALLRTKEALRRSKEAKQKKFGEEQGTQSERSRQKPVKPQDTPIGAVAVSGSKEKGGLSKEGKEAPTQKTVSSKEGGVEQNRIPEIPTPAPEEDKGVSYSGEAIPNKGVSYSGEAIPKKGVSYSGEAIPKKGVVGSSNENPMVMAGDKNRASKELRGSVELWPRK